MRVDIVLTLSHQSMFAGTGQTTAESDPVSQIKELVARVAPEEVSASLFTKNADR